VAGVTTPPRTSHEERLLGAHIARIARAEPLRRALVFGDREWSYADVDLAVETAVRRLAALGVRRGDVVLMAGTARPAALFTMFAVARLGAVLVPVHPSSTRPEVAAIAAAASPALTVGDTDFLDRVLPAGPTLRWDAEDDAASSGADARPVDQWLSDPDDPVIVAFTSGTSGRAKGVVLTHDNLWWSVRNALESLAIGPEDVVLVATPIAHAAVFAGLPQHAWTVGATVVLLPGFDAERFLDAVERHGVTIAFAVSTMLSRLVRSPRWATASGWGLRRVLAGGGPLPEPLARALSGRGVAVINSYGLTEASAGVTYAQPEDADHVPSSAGRPVRHVELRVVDPTGRTVGPGEQGEIWLRGPSLAREYLDPEGRRVPAVDGDGWLHTGDRGLLDRNGRLFVIGRIKDTIVTGGENIDPTEVEDALGSMPGIHEVAVVGVSDPVWGETVTAVIVPEDRAEPSVEDVRRHLDSRLSRHKQPRQVILVDSLPRTPTGKLRRSALSRRINDETAERRACAP
jgi:fatty-acyl-CoA synthase